MSLPKGVTSPNLPPITIGPDGQPHMDGYAIALNPEGGYTVTKNNWLLDKGVPLAVGGIMTAGVGSALAGGGAAASGGGAAAGGSVGSTAASSASPWGSIISAGSSLFGNLFGANKQAQTANQAAEIEAAAQKYAADQTAAATAAALAFQKQSAENSFQNTEADRQGNYGQWAAREARLGSVGAALGYGGRTIPAYVPGVDPQFNAAAAGAPPATGYVAPSTQPTYAPSTGASGLTPAPAPALATAPASAGAYLVGGPDDPNAPRIANAPIIPYQMNRSVPMSVGAYLGGR